jgi:hypothetical protein
MGLGPDAYETSRRLADTRDETELTTFMGLAARLHNAACRDGTATSTLVAERAEARLKAGMLALMQQLHIGPGEFDDNGKPQYGQNKLCRKLLEVKVVTDSGEVVRLDEVESWELAQKHLWRLHAGLVRRGLEDESIFDRNLAPLVHSWYRRKEGEWDVERNALKEARLWLRRREASLSDEVGPPAAGHRPPSTEALAMSAAERQTLTRVVREMPPMHRLVFLLGYDRDDLTHFRIPPREVGELVTEVVAGACDTVDGTSEVVARFNDGRQEAIGTETLRMAIGVSKIAIREQPELRERRWTRANVTRVVREIDEQLSEQLGERIRRRGGGDG